MIIGENGNTSCSLVATSFSVWTDNDYWQSHALVPRAIRKPRKLPAVCFLLAITATRASKFVL